MANEEIGRIMRSKGKPSVAFINQQTAFSNIDAKIDFLTYFCDKNLSIHAVSAGVQQDYLEVVNVLPTSKRDFNAFDSTNLPQLKLTVDWTFRSNSANTLRKCETRTRAVEGLLKAVELLTQSPKKSEREEKIASIKRRLFTAINLRIIAEETIYAQKRSIISLQDKVRSTENQLSALKRETETVIERLAEEIDLLRKGGGFQSSKGSSVVSINRGKLEDRS